MKIKKLNLLLFIFFFITANSLMAKDYPDEILHKSFGMQSVALDSIRNVVFNSNDYSKCLSTYKKLEEWAGNNGDLQLKQMFRLYQYILAINKDKAEDGFDKRLIEFIAEADENQRIYVKTEGLELLADYYWRLKSYSSSLENYIYAYQNYSAFTTDEFPHKTEFLYQLAGKYYHFRDFKTAKKYFLEIWRKLPYEKTEGVVTKLNTLALCYSLLEEYDSAAYYFHIAGDIAVKNKDETWEGIISGNLGNNYLKQKKYNEAIPLLEKNIELSRKNHLMEDLAVSLSEYGSVLLIKNEYKKDLDLQQEALEIMDKKGLRKKHSTTARIYPNVAKAFAANGNMAMAYAYSDSAIVSKELLEKERNMIFVSGVQHKIDIEKHKAELQKKEAELNEQKLYRNSLLFGFATVLLFSIVFFVQKKKIATAKQLSDKLLLNILPVDVAEELKSKGKTEARDYEMATVMFTDFKNFTKISEQLSPAKLVEDIDYCFSAFDNIIHKYGVEKIKTIGDAYMCAGGLPLKNSTHPEDTVRAALEIRDFMEKHNKEKVARGEYPYEIRIGINTGPLVAGIVGVKKFAYDIWGDTVNLAARMESSGKEGKVNISGSTYELVNDKFSCTYRGKIDTKNKAEVDMYFAEYDDTTL